MPITPQERELVIIGAAVACGCKARIRQDMLVANQLHVTDKEITDTIAIAIDIRRRATNSLEDFTSLGLFDSMEPEPNSIRCENSRMTALVSVGAAFAVNCVSGLKRQLASARSIGIEEAELDAAVNLSSFIKAMADSHVERLMNPNGFEDDSYTLAEYGTPFGPERCAWAEMCKAEAERSSNTGVRDSIKLTGTFQKL